MSQGGSFSKSDSSNQSNFDNWAQQNISPDQQNSLNQLWSGAQQYLTNETGGLRDFADAGNARQAVEASAAGGKQRWNTGQSNQAWNDQLQGGVYGGMDNANQLSQSLQQSMNQPSNMQSINNMIMGGSGNNYADALKGQYVNDANVAQQNMLGNMDARAAASGMSGGSAHGNAIGRGMEDINRNLQRNMAQTGYNTFDKDLDRKLNIASQADNATLQRQGMMQNMIGQQQQGIQGAIQNTGNQQGYAMSPYNTSGQFTDQALQRAQGISQGGLSWLQGLIGGTTVLDSSGATGSSSGSSRGKGMGAQASLK